MMVADKFDERRRIGLPILGETIEVFENRIDACRTEKSYRILGVFVEVRVEDTLILKVGFSVDFENLPAQIVQLEHGEAVWLLGHRFLDLSGMLVDSRFAAGDQLRDD